MTTPWYRQPCQPINQTSIEQALEHQANLTKPCGSLGLLEDIAVSFCGWQGTIQPSCDKIQIVVFAGDHGVCQQGVSAYPQEVTAQMVANFLAGGAAINVLAKKIDAELTVVNMGIKAQVNESKKLNNIELMPGTNDFTKAEAMSAETMSDAMEAGRNQINKNAQLFIGGDMGIGNTTSASTIYSLLLKLSPQTTVGPGTGVDKAGIEIKQQVVANALDLHKSKIRCPEDILRCVGGLEIAGLVGAYIACAQRGIPILVDGFIATAAALLATEINPDCRKWMMFAHNSAEPGHQHALSKLNAEPILNIGMRLGEGSGAGVAVPIIISALALHNRMATFSNAGVSGKQP